MQRANAEFADRVSNILNDAIGKLSLNSDGSPETSTLGKNLEALKIATLSVLFQDETLRTDIHKFECEQSTKNDELCRLQTKLRTMREAREERRAELDNELSVLRKLFNEKQQQLAHEQGLSEQSEVLALGSQQSLFENELEALKQEQQELLKQQADARSSYTENESNIRTNISRLRTEIHQLSYDHEIVSKAKLTDIETIRANLEQQKKEQRELENHFKMVDLNNAMKMQEEEQLKKVAALEDMAKALLDDGAIALQKVWRGSKDRKLVASMKSKQSKKGGKSKKKK
ncbi:hypothetical protein ACHAWU_008485 [Discostella pseudostelligera]|uniref:IQ domain-containing protein D n=1 Tax=Discostella pseudostelligera TaxID=259834 RepID=A0ABD3LZZ7_9STRA